ncbi:unnamed protein product [Ranitomeya imitator]|uniref:Dynein light chain Tctex-type 1 n=2 Tax=Neobatrachia TaxID=8416 RepID=A0ABN9LCD1_9NEOB|nr:unnamed protein product [Ranitomeya imitator]
MTHAAAFACGGIRMRRHSHAAASAYSGMACVPNVKDRLAIKRYQPLRTLNSKYFSIYWLARFVLTVLFVSVFQSSFVVDEVSNIIKESIESAIGGNAYQHNKVNQWTTNVVEQTLSQLTKLGKPFKYIVTCVIMQKNGAGLHTASSCFWDNSTDGSCTVRWENKTMYCIVSAFGLAI